MNRRTSGNTFITRNVIATFFSLLLLTLTSFTPSMADTFSGGGGGTGSIASRTTTFTYDARGQFVTSSTNALGHSESYTYDARFGVKLSQTGPNGLTTTWSYDGFGRQTGEVRADGTSTTVTREWCNGFLGKTGHPHCPLQGALALTTETDGAPTSVAMSDALGRVLRSATVGRDGQIIFSDTQYNARGEIAKQSRPYFEGDTPLWSEFYYDVLSRVYREISPDGSQNNTGFNGLSTTAINALGQINERTKNVLGNIVHVYDNDGNDTLYRYDAFGNLVETEDADGNKIINTYDRRGRKIAMQDPDMGSWSYQYNALSELISQTDAKGQSVTFEYDKLGRMISRVDPEGISTWTYDTASQGIGKLAQATGHQGDVKTYQYDSLGRASSVTTQVDGQSFTVSTAYDSYSRTSSITYPSSQRYPAGLVVGYEYTDAAIDGADGYLKTVTNQSDATLYWQATAQDAEGHLTEWQLGNGVTSQYNYTPQTGLISSIQSRTGVSTNDIQMLGFEFDAIGNLTKRTDYNQQVGAGLTDWLYEDFQYDNLNRVTHSQVAGQTAKVYSYDALGNITFKTGVGNYSYGQSAGPHAVTQVDNNGVLTSYQYDANGNMITGSGRTISYSSFNKPTAISTSTATIAFSYDADRSRIKRENLSTGETRYYIGELFEQEQHNSLTTYTHYIKAAGSTIAIETSKSNQEASTHYLHKDHLGSVTAITDQNGLIVEEQSYDAHGKRRNSDWTDITGPTPSSATTDRGFTGHEHIDEVGLVHMNGRVYDPTLGRFISADPHIQAAYNSQSLNRYSYVLNNPLSFTDPSGFFFKSVFKAIKKAIKGIVKAVKSIHSAIQRLEDSILKTLAKVPALNAVAQVAVCYFSGPYCSQALAAYNTRQTYAVTGDLKAAFRSGVVAYASVELFGYKREFMGFKDTLVYMASAQNPKVGAALNFAFYGGVNINGISSETVKNLIVSVKDFYVGKAVGHLAIKAGLTTMELNVVLGLNSYVGKTIAGTAYYEVDDDNVKMLGFFNRDKIASLGVIWDVNDTILGYQGLIDAVGNDYIKYGSGRHISLGHSLGALRSSNLVARGYAGSANIYSLPFGNSAPDNVNVTLGAGDIVNGGFMGKIFNPNATLETRRFGCMIHAMSCYGGE